VRLSTLFRALGGSTDRTSTTERARALERTKQGPSEPEFALTVENTRQPIDSS